MLDVCQVDVESHGIIFNCRKTVCMTIKAKTQKALSSHCRHWVYKE